MYRHEWLRRSDLNRRIWNGRRYSWLRLSLRWVVRWLGLKSKDWGWLPSPIKGCGFGKIILHFGIKKNQNLQKALDPFCIFVHCHSKFSIIFKKSDELCFVLVSLSIFVNRLYLYHRNVIFIFWGRQFDISAVAKDIGVTLTSTVDIVHAIRAGQSILPMREGHMDYASSYG